MDNLSKKHRSWNMSRIKGKNTKPELIVRSLLHKMGYRFRLHRKNLPGKPDIVLPKYKTLIFVHGCFWHQHEGCKRATMPKSNEKYWKKKLKGNVSRFEVNKFILEQKGWNIIVIWECETKKQLLLEKILDRIKLNR